MKKKNPYVLTLPLMENPTEDQPIYFVEPELLEWAKLHADFYIQRYRQGLGTHWNQEDERTTYVGLLGQKIFDVLLQQLEIFAIHNDPVIDWRRKKQYDHNVHDLGTVEVKTFDHYCKYALVKLSEWHKNDYLVVFKFEDREPTKVTMVGYLTGKEVESLPIARKGQYTFSQLANCYYVKLDDPCIHKASEFIQKLLNTKD